MRFRLVLVAAIAVFIVGQAPTAVGGDDPPKAAQAKATQPEPKVEQDIVYTKAGSVELKLDVTQPAEAAELAPAVLVIHGGAWRAGNKSDMKMIASEFARRGYVAISPQYRFCPKETFPAQVHDV